MTYNDCRPFMRPGDVMAFSGRGIVSEIVKLATRTKVSHVGVILENFTGPVLIESTSIDGGSGVRTQTIDDVVANYNGEIWWLPLSADIRMSLNETRFMTFLRKQIGLPYDKKQAVKAGIDIFDSIGLSAKEDFSAFFCSELVVAGLEAGGILPGINASEVTPIDLCRLAIYAGRYRQIKGLPGKIVGWNTFTRKDHLCGMKF